MFSSIISTIGFLLLILLVVILSLALVLGLAVGVGWLLTLVLPFSLFEASLLGLIAAVIAGIFWYTILNSTSGFGSEEYDDEDEYDDDDDYEKIPASRFFKTKADKTWEAWLRYQIANDIYLEFQDAPHPVAPMGEKQQQELAIRLADVTIPLLKAKTARAKQLKVTIATLKRQMSKMGQRPYDDNILKLAATAINDDLDYYHEDIITVIRAKLWDAPCDMFEWQ